MATKMWMKIVKKWGEHAVGDVVLFDQSKAKDLMGKGILEKAKPPKPKRSAPKVETAVDPQVGKEEATAPPQASTEPTPDSKDKSRAGAIDEPGPELKKARSTFGRKKAR